MGRQLGALLGVKSLPPLLPSDIDLLTRPVSYVTVALLTLGGNDNAAEIYFNDTRQLNVKKGSNDKWLLF